MQITRGNYSQYANMVQQMFGNKKNPNNPLHSIPLRCLRLCHCGLQGCRGL